MLCKDFKKCSELKEMPVQQNTKAKWNSHCRIYLQLFLMNYLLAVLIYTLVLYDEKMFTLSYEILSKLPW